MRRGLQWLKDSFIANPLAWLLFALFLIAEHANYQKGKLLDQVCELTGEHDAAYGNPATDREKLDTICVDRQPDPYDDDDR